MMVVSYIWGQKNYRIPYPTKKLIAYILIAVMVSFIHYSINAYFEIVWINYAVATVLLGLYFLFIFRVERKEFAKLPIIGKYVKPGR